MFESGGNPFTRKCSTSMYRKPGWFEVSLGFLMPSWAQTIVVNPDWRERTRALAKSFSDNLRRKVSFIPEEEIFSVSSVRDPLGSPFTKAFVHMWSRWFKNMGMISSVPRCVAYKPYPQMGMIDLIDVLMEQWITIPSKEALKDPSNATLEECLPAFQDWLRHTAALAAFRLRLADHLLRILQHIGWELASTGTFASPFDRSFYLAFCDPSSPAWTIGRTGPRAGDGAEIPAARKRLDDYNRALDVAAKGRFRPVQNTDTAVMATHAALSKAALSGPYDRFFVGRSNQSIYELMAHVLLHTPSLPFHVGYQYREGSFTRAFPEHSFTWTWDLNGHINALVMATRGVGSANLVGAIAQLPPHVSHTPWRASLPAEVAAALAPSFDVEEVRFRLPDGTTSYLDEYEASWMSTSRGQQASTGKYPGLGGGASSETLLLDRCLNKAAFGGGEVGIVDIMPYLDLYDAEYMGHGTYAADKWVDYARAKDAWKQVVLIRERGGIRRFEVDMRPYYQSRGELMVRPAFCEFPAFDPSTLELPLDPSAEGFIFSQIPMSNQWRKVNEIFIRMSHNRAYVQRLFNAEIMSLDEMEGILNARHGSSMREVHPSGRYPTLGPRAASGMPMGFASQKPVDLTEYQKRLSSTQDNPETTQ